MAYKITREISPMTIADYYINNTHRVRAVSSDQFVDPYVILVKFWACVIPANNLFPGCKQQQLYFKQQGMLLNKIVHNTCKKYADDWLH